MRRLHGPANDASDESLLAGMAQGDTRCAVAFVRRYQRRVFGLAFSMVGETTLAEDIAQEALVRAWRHAPVFDPRRGSVTTWLLTITRNLSIDSLRIRRSTPVDPETLLTFIGFDAKAESAFDQFDQSDQVRTALAMLPPEQQRAIVLSVLYGFTAEEVSVSEDIPLGTAKSRIRAGLSKLRTGFVTEEGHQ